MPSVMLIRKLVAVLESIERLPMFLYDSPGSSYGLQVSCNAINISYTMTISDFLL